MAFPYQMMDFQPTTGQQVVREQGFGLTKLEWFAGLVVQSLVTEQSIKGTRISELSKYPETVASMAFDVAEAMLKESEKRSA